MSIRKSHGEIAYEAYRDFAGGVSLINDQPIPEYADLPSHIRSAWNIAAAAVVNYVLDDEPCQTISETKPLK